MHSPNQSPLTGILNELDMSDLIVQGLQRKHDKEQKKEKKRSRKNGIHPRGDHL